MGTDTTAGIRAHGGVSRMSDPKIETVSIPVMSTTPIGHFLEAQVLQSLWADYIDESEVLSPADCPLAIDRWNFIIPFVCGATNVGEAQRRIAASVAMLRSKGEVGATWPRTRWRTCVSICVQVRPPQSRACRRVSLALQPRGLRVPFELGKDVATSQCSPSCSSHAARPRALAVNAWPSTRGCRPAVAGPGRSREETHTRALTSTLKHRRLTDNLTCRSDKFVRDQLLCMISPR